MADILRSTGFTGAQGDGTYVENAVNGAFAGADSSFDLVVRDEDNNVVSTTSMITKAGVSGKTITTGDGAPATSLGIVGDVYIDLTNSLIYTKVGVSDWGTGVEFKGNPGNDGDKGEQGLQGVQGTANATAFLTETIGTAGAAGYIILKPAANPSTISGFPGYTIGLTTREFGTTTDLIKDTVKFTNATGLTNDALKGTILFTHNSTLDTANGFQNNTGGGNGQFRNLRKNNTADRTAGDVATDLDTIFDSSPVISAAGGDIGKEWGVYLDHTLEDLVNPSWRYLKLKADTITRETLGADTSLRCTFTDGGLGWDAPDFVDAIQDTIEVVPQVQTFTFGAFTTYEDVLYMYKGTGLTTTNTAGSLATQNPSAHADFSKVIDL